MDKNNKNKLEIYSFLEESNNIYLQEYFNTIYEENKFIDKEIKKISNFNNLISKTEKNKVLVFLPEKDLYKYNFRNINIKNNEIYLVLVCSSENFENVYNFEYIEYINFILLEPLSANLNSNEFKLFLNQLLKVNKTYLASDINKYYSTRTAFNKIKTKEDSLNILMNIIAEVSKIKDINQFLVFIKTQVLKIYPNIEDIRFKWSEDIKKFFPDIFRLQKETYTYSEMQLNFIPSFHIRIPGMGKFAQQIKYFGDIYFIGISDKEINKYFSEELKKIISTFLYKTILWQEYQTERDKWQYIFDSLPLGTALVKNDIIFRANKTWGEIFKINPKYIIGENINNWIKLEEGIGDNNIGNSISRKIIKINERFYDISKYHIINPEEQQNTSEYLMILYDITEKVLYKEKLINTEKMAELGILAGSIAHDINNPIGGISSLLELLKNHTNLQEEYKEDLEYMYEASLRCKNIAQNLLRFSRHARNYQKAFVPLKELVESATSLIELEVKYDNIDIEVDINPSISVEVIFSHMIQIILNALYLSVYDLKNSNKLYNKWIKISALEKETEDTIIISLLIEYNARRSAKNTELDLKLFVIKNLLREYEGHFEVEEQWQKGDTITRYFVVFNFNKDIDKVEHNDETRFI